MGILNNCSSIARNYFPKLLEYININFYKELLD